MWQILCINDICLLLLICYISIKYIFNWLSNDCPTFIYWHFRNTRGFFSQFFNNTKGGKKLNFCTQYCEFQVCKIAPHRKLMGQNWTALKTHLILFNKCKKLMRLFYNGNHISKTFNCISKQFKKLQNCEYFDYFFLNHLEISPCRFFNNLSWHFDNGFKILFFSSKYVSNFG